jgi:hypothetical protein
MQKNWMHCLDACTLFSLGRLEYLCIKIIYWRPEILSIHRNSNKRLIDFTHYSVSIRISMVRFGILDPWPSNSRFWPTPASFLRKICLFTHNKSSYDPNRTYANGLKLGLHGHMYFLPNPDRTLNVLYKAWRKNPSFEMYRF